MQLKWRVFCFKFKRKCITVWWQSGVITPVSSVTWSFRNHSNRL